MQKKQIYFPSTIMQKKGGGGRKSVICEELTVLFLLLF